MFQPQEELAMEGLSSSIAYEMLNSCDDIADLYPDTLRSSEISSFFGGDDGSCVDPWPCYDDDSFITPSAFSLLPSIDPSTFSAVLDTSQPPPDDIAAVISSYLPPPPLPVPPTNLSDQPDHLCHKYTEYSPKSAVQLVAGPLLQPPSPLLVCEEESLSTASAYVGLYPSSFMDAGVIGGGGGGLYMGGGTSVLEGEQSWYQGGTTLGPEETGMAPMEMVMGGGGIGFYGRCYSSSDLQVLGDGHQNLVGSCGSTKPLVASDVSALDESSYNVCRLSVEERKEKIHRYIKKRNERNFHKKIKYACRKTLADKRPRVRGRFAKNDEFGDAARPNSSTNHEYDDT